MLQKQTSPALPPEHLVVQDILDGTLLKGRRKVASFVELHIEQGPRLEAEGKAIGIVQAIAAPAAMRVAFHGDGGHAGAQLMPLRNDASLAAAELALEVEKAVLATGDASTRNPYEKIVSEIELKASIGCGRGVMEMGAMQRPS